MSTAPSDGEDLVEFSGEITDYWSYSQIRDYVLMLPGLGHSALHLYLLLRSMVMEASRRPRGGLRRMTIDQLCWLLTDDKPVSISSVYELLKALDKVGLVQQKDQQELEGASKLKGKAKAARGIARGFTVKDLPPPTYTGWRNAWDKLDAYRADWREDLPQPPTHITEPGEDADGRPISRLRVVDADGQAFQKSGTAQVEADEAASFQISGTAFQKSGTAVQNSGTDLALTSANAPLEEAPLRSSSLSSPAPATSASPSAVEDGGEREAATPDKTAADAGVPEQRSAQTAPAAAEGAELVVQAYVAAASAAGVIADRRDVAGVRRDAAGLLAEVPECTPEWLGHRAAEMPAKGWSDLRRHVAKCKKPMRAPQKRASSKPCTKCMDSGWLEDENGMPAGKCDCRGALVPA
ncbi:hypothetical protein ABZ686_02280 [Streptomyces sp. NPDC006992]|uniref:hypothetical protein n=1 Tax=Streptomyces sp. NPDC006992 TaxID=3155601 RepID=UPI0033E1F7DF